MAAIFDLRHTQTSNSIIIFYCVYMASVLSGSVTDKTIEKFNPKKMWVAVGILFLASLEAEIPLAGSRIKIDKNGNSFTPI